jgi:GntR family transcriptional repressor for pyruvate dehydrogenase complex
MFTPIKSTRVYEQVVVQIKRMIIDGTLKKGDKLPAERDLAEELQVSRTSVREALRALDVIGLVEIRQGAGNYIKESFGNSLFEPMSMMFMLEKGTPHEILEFRKVLEVEAAVLAAARINDEEVEALGMLLEKMKSCDNEDSNIVLDKEFHFTIAKASKNLLIINILQVISQLIDEFIKDSRKKILRYEDNGVRLTIQHEMLYRSLKNRDINGAYSAINGHFKLIEDCFYE